MRLTGMKIVIDEKIPYLKNALEELGYNVSAKPGCDITSSDVSDAKALFVRTRTRCGKGLLDGSDVRFIGTATIGHDHIDSLYCMENGIRWSNAAGCNAGAVLQYVQSVIHSWTESLEGISIGVVGVGNIGSRVASWASYAGMTVYRNDPPKALAGENGFVSLEEIAEKCEIITFHTTLQRDGAFPSWHLADERFFDSLKRCRLLINASRGEVVDNLALLSALKNGLVADAAIDVWENEPYINKDLLNMAFVATPHIAGYSAEGKLNATRMVLEAFLDFEGRKDEMPVLAIYAPEKNLVEAVSEREALLSIYSPVADTVNLKQNPCDFEQLRNNYSLRREPESYRIVIKQQ